MSDYTDIQQELDDFENAVYGEEVRSSMISAIKKIHDIAESAAGAPDASSATAGQAPIADGQGGWAWGDVATSGDSVPTEVRQAILALFQNAAYISNDMADEVAVVQSWATEITAISVSPTTLSISGSATSTITAVTSPAGGAVIWSSSNISVATVSGGVVTGVSNGTCTITASCGGKSASCAVTVSGFATLTGITAVYTQSGTVYETDTLDSLKADLVVTASYDDSTTQTVTDYTLSGTLTEGTSTITVSYGGKSTTFTCVVSIVTPETIVDTISKRQNTSYKTAQYMPCVLCLGYDDTAKTTTFGGKTITEMQFPTTHANAVVSVGVYDLRTNSAPTTTGMNQYTLDADAKIVFGTPISVGTNETLTIGNNVTDSLGLPFATVDKELNPLWIPAEVAGARTSTLLFCAKIVGY